MNKVTLSVAALAAIAVPVQAQVLTGDAKKAAVEDVKAYINDAHDLVTSFGYKSVCQPYQVKLNDLWTTFNTKYVEGTEGLTNEICVTTKLAAQAAVDEASNAKKPYEVKDELQGIKENLITLYGQVLSRIDNDANYSDAFIKAKIAALKEYKEGRAATDKLAAIVGLDEIKLDSYDLSNDKIVQDRQTIKDQLAVIDYALKNTFSKETLDAEYANNTNDAAFKYVNDEIARVEGVITAKFNDFRTLFPLEETVWTDWYNDAFTKLGAYQQDLKKVAQYNKEAHESADESKNALALQGTNLSEISRIEGEIDNLYIKYDGLKTAEAKAYKEVGNLISEAKGVLNGKLTALHEKNINVTLIDTQINQLISDIDNFKTNKLDAAYNAHQAVDKQSKLESDFKKVLENVGDPNYSYTKLQTYADKLVQNKKDYNSMISNLDDKLKALSEKEKKAKEASKVDKSYNPAAHFTTEYNRIKDTMVGGEKTKLANDLKAVNPVDGNDGKYPNTSYKNDVTNGITKALTDIQTAIDNYASGTANALEYFDIAKKTYDDNKKLYDELVKTATNTSVTIDGLAVTETTYAVYIAKVKGELDAINSAIATANGMNDFDHRDEMKKASEKTVDSRIEALTEGYGVNEKNWNQNVRMANAENTYAAVSGDLQALKDRVTVIQKNLDGTNKDSKKLYGDTEGSLKCELAVAIQKSIKTINTTKDTGIDAVDTDIKAMFKAYTDLGIDDANIAKKLEAADKVTAKKDAWNKLISDIATKVDQLEADAKVAAENKSAYDVLAAKANAASDGKGNVAYAIENTLSKIQQHYVSNGIANYTDDAGYGYFNTLLSTTKTKSLTSIRTNIEKSFKAGKMVADEKSKNYDGQLNTLKEDVEGQYMKAINNLDKYKTQCKRIDGTQNDKGDYVGGLNQTYDAVLALVKADQTSAAADMLKQLATAKSELETLRALVNTNYAQGKCDTENAKYEETFNAISEKIEAVRNQQSKWPEVLRQDNLNEHNNFLNVSFKSAKDKFDEAVSIINEFSSIKNDAVKKALEDLVETHKAIFDYADSLRVLQVNENAAFEANKALTDPTLYVATEYKNKAKDFVAGIEKELQKYCNGVNEAAWNQCQERLTYAYNELSTAQTYVNNNYKSKEAIANAFADLKSTVNGALGAAAGSTKETDIKDFVNGGSFDPAKCDRRFAAIVDESFEELEQETFDAALAAAKVEVAIAEYNWTYKHAIDSYNDENKAISEITNPAVDKDDYLAQIKDLKEKNIDAGKKLYDEYNGNDLFKYVVTVTGTINGYFDNTTDEDKNHNYTWKSKPYKDVLDLLNNLEYQAGIQAVINTGEQKINGYADELNALFAAHIEGNSTIYDAINKMYSDLYAFDVANAVKGDGLDKDVETYVNGKVSDNGSIEAQMASIRSQAITLEIETLENEVQRVKEQYNNAFKEIGVGFDADHKYANKIEDLRVRLNNSAAKGTEGYIPGYSEKWANNELTYVQAYQQLLGVQREIAQLSSDIASEYKDGSAISNAAALLAQKSAEVTAVVSKISEKIHEFAAIEAEVGADIDKLVKDLEGVDEDVTLKTADETVLFYKLNFITDYDRILTACNELWKGKISVSSSLTVKDAYARYKNNDDNYKTLIDNLDNVIVAKYNAVKSEVDAFEFYETVFKEWVGNHKVYEHWTTAEERKLDEAVESYRNVIETAAAEINLKNGVTAEFGITNPNDSKFTTPADNLKSDIATFEKDAKYKEASQTYLPNISNTLNSVDWLLSSEKYAPTTEGELQSEYSTLSWARDCANSYNFNVYKNSGTFTDIDGKPIEIIPSSDPTDPNARPSFKWVTKDYVAEVWPEVKAKAAELQAAANELLARAQANSYILGDVDHDGKVTVIDYARVRNMILSGITYDDIADEVVRYSADATVDKKINVADLSQISTFIFGENVNNASRAALFASDFSAENKIAAAIDSEETTIFGKTVRVAINVESGVAFTAGQFDVKLPAGMKLVGASLSERANGHEVLTGDLENGMKRVVVSVVENNSFNGNNGALVYLDVEVASEFNGGNIEVSDAIFTDGCANSYYLTNNGPVVPTGIDGVEAATAKERIYSVGGQMMKAVKKGINILVGDDNKSKKVVNK
ncbi:MAG: dockerin type I repeat-containing protein [Prevotella sp.]|nr:dockerin type I repeat-containing protein [Prevotella sp.]